MTSTTTDLEPTLAPTSRFTVKPEPGENAWHSELVFDGVATGRRVAGLHMEAQFSYGDRWLLLLDNDTPFEGYLFMLLLDSSLKPIERRELGTVWGMGIAGFVTDIRIVAPSALEFGFFGEHDRWRLTILRTPRFIWMGQERPLARQWRKLFSRRWMTLDELTAGPARAARESAGSAG